LEGRRRDSIPYDIGSDAESEDDDGKFLDETSKSSNDNDGEDSEEGDYRLGDHMAEAWNNCSEKLHMNIAIAGWMCSADPLVMKDANEHHIGKHRDAVTTLLKQWYMHEVGYSEDKMGSLINSFWQEFEEFQYKTGPYANREYIFQNHVDLSSGNIHFWHKKEMLCFTIIFGRFACRVCSKILGIGTAERSWGDVKHLKTNQQSHLSSRATKMQATIFGASCVELAKIKQQDKFIGSGLGPCKVWRLDDFTNEMATGNVVVDNTPAQYFQAWIEDWEVKAQKQKDPVNETKLLAKYGGLKWRDPDNGNAKLIADKNKLHWRDWTKKKGGGYTILACDEHYRDDDPGKGDHVEPWYPSTDLIECIAEIYKMNKAAENVK
jgi:hypothetical protein